MWHIIATVCFFDLSVPELEKACFPNAYFPTGYPTEEHCMKVAQGIIDLLNDDLSARGVQVTFSCLNKRSLVMPPDSLSES
jgi:hypothetical protein|tara:strand:+ start:841 stop:1083 length:243 start_codon:yes stop_codon:yes gene_type:complete